jgi:hypothetical protein
VVKKDKNAVFMSLFLVKFSVAHFIENMPKVVGLIVVFSSIFALILRPFVEHILFYFWKKQTQHFIPRKLTSKPNARGKVRNNKHKTITY